MMFHYTREVEEMLEMFVQPVVCGFLLFSSELWRFTTPQTRSFLPFFRCAAKPSLCSTGQLSAD